MSKHTSIKTAALSGALAVALGAFGAHALKPMLLETGRLDTFELAVRYQFYHTLALLFTGIAQSLYQSAYLRLSAIGFTSGILLFSGSLYALCFTGHTWIAFITPFGGTLLIGGWLLLLTGVLKSKSHSG
ncbi:MAG: DUF423 domain-containing protein [Flammeovirgaceae bacterium]|nr:MAG: DUF423 domain-containing protein [Flammeovirgaceae bacterium]